MKSNLEPHLEVCCGMIKWKIASFAHISTQKNKCFCFSLNIDAEISLLLNYIE